MSRDFDLEVRIAKDGFIEESASSSGVTSRYPVTGVYWAGKTKFCDEVIIAESEEFGKMLFLDGEIQSTEADEAIYHEHLVHPAIVSAMQNYDTPEEANLRVLVLGGGEGATVRELLRYPASVVREIVWIDIDGELVNLCREYLGFAKEKSDIVYGNTERCVFVPADANTVLADPNTPEFDVVICDLPDPDPKFPALYGQEFWEAIKSKLRDADSVIVTHVGPVAAIKGGCDLLNYVRENMKNAGLPAAKLCKVAIPSFQSEWGFLITNYPFLRSWGYYPTGLTILDNHAISKFTDIWPAYYSKLVNRLKFLL